MAPLKNLPCIAVGIVHEAAASECIKWFAATPNKLPFLHTLNRPKSSFSLEMDFSHQNPNSNPNCTFFPENLNPMPDFELSDYLMLDNAIFDDDTYMSQSIASSEKSMAAATQFSGATSKNSNIKCKNGVGKYKSEVRVAFRMKSGIEVMDDGYKWRKYGKKSIKNSPNPRHYYKCSSGGCNVKKRIERDINDGSYEITTYEGVHNHETPSMLYHNQMPLTPPNASTFKASPPPPLLLHEELIHNMN
ncbi:probable WRKY transcription factor 51 [Hibiscus syriacus]|uniref:probable WRKY transcription factor 51 n=1 Tax=Hibiscus syriacus TaxID=106335 RepID=UPI00192134E6|nr:probable WRKY transcription factor 51 [Hibiscus syriacus]